MCDSNCIIHTFKSEGGGGGGGVGAKLNPPPHTFSDKKLCKAELFYHRSQKLSLNQEVNGLFKAKCIFFFKIRFFMLFSFLTLLHWKPNTLIHHKVNGPNFILSLDNLNEWISPWLSQRRFNITWPPSLFLMGRRVVYLASLILFLYFQ